MRKAFVAFLFALLLPFTAKANSCPGGTYFLDPDIEPTSMSSDETNKTWQATASYGTVSGVAVCNGTPGTFPIATSTNFPNGTSGFNCWCKMTNPATSSWVALYQFDSVSTCASSCAMYCRDYVRYNSSFRTSVFNSADNTCITCPAGYYCTGGVRGNCADVTGPNGRPQYSAAVSSSCTECPTVTGALAGRIASSYNGWWPNNIHDSVGGCYVYFYDDDPDATYLTRCFYSSGEYGGTNSGCYTPSSTVTCVAGKYKTIESIPEYDSTNQLTYCKGVDCVKGRVCTDVGVGYYSPDGDTVRYACENKPSNSHFACSGTANTREWECDSGYVEYNNACHARCPVNTGRIHADQYSHPLFADKTNMPSPVLHIQYVDGTMCYGYLEPGFAPAGEHGIHIFYNGAVYHAVNPGD